MNEMELEVFRAGDYGPKGKWSEEDLDRIAADYAAETHEAPVTLDHAQRGPALGWVAGLRRSGDRLLARLRDVSAELRGLVRSGAFKKRSIELYRAMPATGRPYFKALSFLGAAAPEVKGLRDPVFAADRAVELAQEWAGAADAVAFEDVMPPVDAFSVDPPETDQAQVTREPSVAFDELTESLRHEGRWNPAWDAMGLREFFSALASVDEIETAPEQFVSPEAWFTEFLRAQPVILPMGEIAPSRAVGFAETLPRAANVSPESIELHRRVVRLRESKPGLSYADALVECGRN